MDSGVNTRLMVWHLYHYGVGKERKARSEFSFGNLCFVKSFVKKFCFLPYIYLFNLKYLIFPSSSVNICFSLMSKYHKSWEIRILKPHVFITQFLSFNGHPDSAIQVSSKALVYFLTRRF